MYKTEVNFNEKLDETTYVTTLKNGLKVYICKKPGFKKKIGLFGTKYGSINNDFLDITTNKRTKVPDGIAHFLEHKLFEQEGANALDLFSKIGVTSNAYTSYDQTVYYFETIDKFKESIELLVKLVKTPYFTDENVEKEQGIIGQEIMMYEDDPNAVLYVNTMKAMYNVNPIRIDIAGTIDTISNINKELLYTCYHTFYSPQNMFFIVVGDVDAEDTIKQIEDNIKIYEKNYDLKSSIANIEKYYEDEPNNIKEKEIISNLDIYMPQLCIGYKLNTTNGNEIVKRSIVSSIISDMFFSRSTQFYETQYNKGNITEPVVFEYEGSSTFSHVLVAGSSTNTLTLKEDILAYINEIKNANINETDFELIKKKRIGNLIMKADNFDYCYRRIINSIVDGNEIYDDIEILDNIKMEDIKNFLNLLIEENSIVSIIEPK